MGVEGWDFKGWATKANTKCKDGRVIKPNAFAHQDQAQVPLVWMHDHDNPENVLGHAILENLPEGVYMYGFLNNTPKAQAVRDQLQHKDYDAMSIWANELVQKGAEVLHGMIREVSLALAGKNPGALIEAVNIRHADGELEEVADEAIIWSGEQIEIAHADGEEDGSNSGGTSGEEQEGSGDEENESVQDVLETLNEKQKKAVAIAIGEAISATKEEAGKSADSGSSDTGSGGGSNDNKEGADMGHNVFAKDGKTPVSKDILSHDNMQSLVSTAMNGGGRSLKEVVGEWADENLEHGIDDIEILFPEAKAISQEPEFLKRRTEWVAAVIGGARKSPFSRIKTLRADITEKEARAKGYIKGNLKKEEFFRVAKRVTTPQTVYKKQALDRDDMIDITDFDVVAWLKGEMRLMLDEEIARAILIGDGRESDDEDKINESNIRPIATDHSLHTVRVEIDTTGEPEAIIDAIILNRRFFKGTGQPTFFTTEEYIARFMLIRDAVGRRIYETLDQLAAAMRVAAVVPVEVMEEQDDLVGILVNMSDYVIGADKGGQVATFEDFDIDFNKHKYLIETRISGALVKLKAAIALYKAGTDDVVVIPNAPTFDAEAGEVSIINTTGVVYRNGAGTVINAASSPYAVPGNGGEYIVTAEAAAGYYFATSEGTQWSFTNRNED